MSFSSLFYDNCSFLNRNNNDVSLHQYHMDDNKYHNRNKMRVTKGIVAGNDVSVIQGDRIMLESDLRRATGMASNCPQQKFFPNCSNMVKIPRTITHSPQNINTSMVHLPEGNIINYNNVYITNLEDDKCPKGLCHKIKF